jgi:hypothetical protein
MTFKNLKLHITSSILNSSQQETLLAALTRRLAIIQGPLGCGKTFIGIELVKLLLSLKPCPRLPILLLTYKNHALDEFLEESLSFLTGNEVARVGGRSKEPMLENCNLKNLKRTEDKSKVFRTELNELYGEKDVFKEELFTLQELHQKSVLTYSDILEALDEAQLTVLYETCRISISMTLRRPKSSRK